ncbi:MAG: PEP-CTERM sorting domain-containing protein [Hyphomicrobiales bacterium]|nr:PEP-CTERM sorting domain-containing protein [Hyphomicrobiales bacterium]MBV9906746.1 PEP-CTERM sorting domain-containing protein [Hyphomicrobiales bacterium]
MQRSSEPSTWAMMLLGFAGLGWAGWRGHIAARTRGAQA